MAGFFGLFDYTKEGPGVSKEEKKKKGFFRFFELYFRNFWSLVKLSAVYSIISIPLVTNGLAVTGMSHVTRSMTRDKHSFGFSDYFDTIKKNWKQALLFGILNTIISVILFFDIYFFFTGTGSNANVVFAVIGLGVSMFLLACLTFIKYYLWTLILTFSLDIKTLIKNSFRFVFLNIWRNILISAVLGIFYAVMIIIPFAGSFQVWALLISLILAIFIFPGFKSFLIQYNTFPAIKKYMIDPYYKAHKGEDIEKRLALGIDVPEDELPKEKMTDAVFSDDNKSDGIF